MEEKAIDHNKLKTAIALRKLLLKSKIYKHMDFDEATRFAKSYGKIATNSDLRKATVSDNFNAKSNVRFATLISIIEGMGFNLREFAKIFDSIEKADLEEYAKIFDHEK